MTGLADDDAPAPLYPNITAGKVNYMATGPVNRDPFTPRNNVERAICRAIPGFAKGKVFNLETREEFLAAHPKRQSIVGDFDYIASAGQRIINESIFAGETVGVKYNNGEIVLEMLERWI
jgi:hypothetical protein